MVIPVHISHKRSPFSLRVWRGDRQQWEVRDIIPKDVIQRIMKGNARQSRFYPKELPVQGWEQGLNDGAVVAVLCGPLVVTVLVADVPLHVLP